MRVFIRSGPSREAIFTSLVSHGTGMEAPVVFNTATIDKVPMQITMAITKIEHRDDSGNSLYIAGWSNGQRIPAGYYHVISGLGWLDIPEY